MLSSLGECLQSPLEVAQIDLIGEDHKILKTLDCFDTPRMQRSNVLSHSFCHVPWSAERQMGDTASDCERCRIDLLGPLRVTGPQGEDLTPRGAKTQGLLALLAEARGKDRSRAWLQDKLWSDRGQVQGRNSLKKALAELRSSLGPYCEKLLHTKAGNVALHRDNVVIDIYEPQEPGVTTSLVRPEFLEGIDIRDSEFNAWLQTVRVALQVRPEETDNKSSPVEEFEDGGQFLADGLSRVSSFCIGLLPLATSQADGTAGLLGDMFLDRLAIGLTDQGVFSIFDYRKERSSPNLPEQPLDLWLQVRAFSNSDTLSLHILVNRVGDKVLVWGDSRTLDLADFTIETVSTVVSQLAELLADVVMRQSLQLVDDDHRAAGHVLRGIDQMFRISAQNLDAAEESFRRAINLDPKGQYLAWKAYLSAFRTEELKGASKGELLDQTEELIQRSLEADSSSGFSLSLLTHVCAFVFRDYERAFSFLERSLSMQHDSPMVHDSRALLHFYTGDLDSAFQAAKRAMAHGIHSPYSYAFATSLCMISAAMEDHKSAIRHGERALSMHPVGSTTFFEPTLRFLCASYGHLGERDQVAPVLRQLKQQDPEISSKRLVEDCYPVPNAKALSILRAGFEIIEQFDL